MSESSYQGFEINRCGNTVVVRRGSMSVALSLAQAEMIGRELIMEGRRPRPAD